MPINPFRIPQFATIFELRDAELEEEAKERERKKNLKIFERSSCKNLTSRRKLLEDEEVVEESDQLDKLKVILQNIKGGGFRLFILLNFVGACIEDETHQEYISKRREMFFLEYSIAIQRAEIERLDELARREEKKLDLAEQCLEQDAALFDEFLKENDKTSVEAIAASVTADEGNSGQFKDAHVTFNLNQHFVTSDDSVTSKRRAEQEARKRSAMGDDIKRLNAQQLQITAEINRLTELVKDYKSYKTFLDRLAPEAYRNAVQRRREIKQLTKDRAKAEAKKLLISKSPTMSEYANYGSTVRRSSFVARRSSFKLSVVASPSPSKQVPMAVEEQESSSSDESDNEIYFSSPEQVLEILADLEEANLRLIRNCQDTQEGIESLKALSATTMERM
ncbi:hypothetical protein P879_07023 [Paragonimus westermani]|uniref:DUF4200 domain-containing protein n=1 Tax=Paragonimus westermani TaxID=34504 RepID=A0A8T0DT54_9TREM|nr:hypothetical protein P879_07023 [Paragonimus westermani]